MLGRFVALHLHCDITTLELRGAMLHSLLGDIADFDSMTSPPKPNQEPVGNPLLPPSALARRLRPRRTLSSKLPPKTSVLVCDGYCQFGDPGRVDSVTYRPGYPPPDRLDSLRQVARIRSPSAPKGHPQPAPEGSSRHFAVFSYPRQEHCHPALQAPQQVPS